MSKSDPAPTPISFEVIEGGKKTSPKPKRGRPHLIDPPGLAAMTFPHDDNHPMNRLPTTAERAVSFDPLDQQGQIGPSDLNVAAVDEKGHSAVIPGVRVPPVMQYQITRIVQSGKYPWKTTADFVRWSLVEGLTKLSHLSADGLLSDANSRMRAMFEVLSAERVYQDFGEMLQRSKQAVDDLEQRGYSQRAATVIRSLASEIDKIRDDDWKRDLQRQFRARFKEYLPKKVKTATSTSKKKANR